MYLLLLHIASPRANCSGLNHRAEGEQRGEKERERGKVFLVLHISSSSVPPPSLALCHGSCHDHAITARRGRRETSRVIRRNCRSGSLLLPFQATGEKYPVPHCLACDGGGGRGGSEGGGAPADC